MSELVTASNWVRLLVLLGVLYTGMLLTLLPVTLFHCSRERLPVPEHVAAGGATVGVGVLATADVVEKKEGVPLKLRFWAEGVVLLPEVEKSHS